MSIAITGANGKLGRLIMEQLRQQSKNEPVVACVRRPEEEEFLAEWGVEVRRCDYDRPGELASAFAGITKLLLISSPHCDDTVRIRQHAQVIEAAKQAGVEHILYTGIAFPGSGQVPPTQLHLATEYAILASGIPYTFFRNALYTDIAALFELDAAIRSGELVTYPGNWLFNTVTRDDLAAAIAAVLSDTGLRHRHRTYELTAPKPWTFGELAAALSELAGKPVVHREDPQIQHWVYGFLGKMDTSSISGDLEALTGRPVMSLKESIVPFVNEA
ncbi:NAD(P)H-binding protein [Paenibacillus sp. TH7-28]